MRSCLMLAMLVLVGCGGSTPSTKVSRFVSPSTGEDGTCAKEVQTGSQFEHKVCRTEMQKAEERRKLDDLYLTPSNRPGGGDVRQVGHGGDGK